MTGPPASLIARGREATPRVVGRTQRTRSQPRWRSARTRSDLRPRCRLVVVGRERSGHAGLAARLRSLSALRAAGCRRDGGLLSVPRVSDDVWERCRSSRLAGAGGAIGRGTSPCQEGSQHVRVRCHRRGGPGRGIAHRHAARSPWVSGPDSWTGPRSGAAPFQTNLIHTPGMAAFGRWGLTDAVRSSGCPPVLTYRLDMGDITIVGEPRGLPEAPVAYAPRRLVLDKLLEAASRAGAEVREAFVVEGLVMDVSRRARDPRTLPGWSRDNGACSGRHRGRWRRILRGAIGRGTLYPEVAALEALYLAYWEGYRHDSEFALYSRGGVGSARYRRTTASPSWS